MKKNKGFTLIELLAVIVVLAIIALIATPIVSNIIKNAKKGAAERSVENYIRAVGISKSTEELDKKYIDDGTYTINEEGDLCLNEDCSNKLIVEMEGLKPHEGKIVIENEKIKKTSIVSIGNYTVINKDNQWIAMDLTNNLCALVEGEALTIGSKYLCTLGKSDDSKNLNFFVLSQTDKEVSLIFDRNLGHNVSWCKNGNNSSCDGDGAKELLEACTKNWNRVDTNKITLPSKDQILNSYTGETPIWLYDNLHGSTNVDAQPSGRYGYWTSTRNNDSTSGAYYMYYNGDIRTWTVNSPAYGVRPVITISKSKLNK